MKPLKPNTLEIGTNERGEVVINHPDLKPDKNGVGHIVFSVEQARQFAAIVERKANEAAGQGQPKKKKVPRARNVIRKRLGLGRVVVVAVAPAFASGPGWANRPCWVVVQDILTGELRKECLQPDEQPVLVREMFSVAAEMQAVLIQAIEKEAEHK